MRRDNDLPRLSGRQSTLAAISFALLALCCSETSAFARSKLVASPQSPGLDEYLKKYEGPASEPLRLACHVKWDCIQDGRTCQGGSDEWVVVIDLEDLQSTIDGVYSPLTVGDEKYSLEGSYKDGEYESHNDVTINRTTGSISGAWYLTAGSTLLMHSYSGSCDKAEKKF